MSVVETINPTSLSDALRVKAERNVTAVAGGTDILVKLHDVLDKPWPRLLVLDRISALHRIKLSKTRTRLGTMLTIGPLMTFSEIESSPVIKKHAPQLAEAASLAGSVQIRNRATIGGNVANGSPAGDTIPPLYVLGALIEMSSFKGKRQVPIEKFFLGPRQTMLKQNELITAIKIPLVKNHGFFNRLATRKALAISKVSVAASLSINKGIVNNARIALGAVAPTVIRAGKAEEYLIGKQLDAQTIARAAILGKDDARPIDDIRSNAIYRKEMVGVLLARGLKAIAEKL